MEPSKVKGSLVRGVLTRARIKLKHVVRSGREARKEQPLFDGQTHSHGACWGAERGAHEEKVEKFRGDDATSHDLLRRWCFSLLGSRHDDGKCRPCCPM